MKKKILIVGKNSNITKSLADKFKNIDIVSSRDVFKKNFKTTIEKKKPEVIIYNAFYPLNSINEKTDLNELLKYTTIVTNEFIKKIKEIKTISQIILSSSSALKNIFINSYNIKNKRALYSSLKLLNEQIFTKFCSDKKINLVVARLFNIYGNYDNSSIIFRILDAKKNNKDISIFNKGDFKRDFIHVNDVVNIYEKFILLKSTGIYEVGTGNSLSIYELIKIIDISKNKIKFIRSKSNEIYKSEADTDKIIKTLKINNFINVKYFLKDSITYNSSKKYKPLRVINLSIPHIHSEEYENVTNTLDDNWVSPVGPDILKLEKEISKFNNYGYTAALSSGTSAIHLALVELGVKPNDYVICQSFTFVASANPILYQHAIPIFIDSEPDTLSMDPEILESSLVSLLNDNIKPKAVIVAHIYGIPGKIYKIKKICNKFNIPLIEDSAETLGSTINNKKCGTFGDVGIFSFNGNKIITSGGGGALIAKNKKFVNNVKSMSTQSREKFIYYEHKKIGFNYRMSNVLASIARAQLNDLNNKINKRKNNFKYYKNFLNKFENINIIDYSGNKSYIHKSNFWLTNIVIKKIKFKQLIELIEELNKEKIETRPLWKPMHMQPFFKKYKYFGKNVSEYYFSKGLSLPSSSNLTIYELEYIVNKLGKYLTKYE